jgi:hypothetical protein
VTLGHTLGAALGAGSFFEPLRFEPSAFFQGFDESFLQIVAYNHNSSRPLYCQQGQSGCAHSGHADADDYPSSVEDVAGGGSSKGSPLASAAIRRSFQAPHAA